MDEQKAKELLQTLWHEPAPKDLECLLCGKSFTFGALIRTFRIEPCGPHDPGYSIIVPTSRGDIVFFDRHMDCIRSHKTPFVAVSHVWDPIISKVQQQQNTDGDAAEATRRALEISVKICDALKGAGHVDVELWLDYLSVPQWSTDLRDNILQIMHNLYNTADTTILYLKDVPPAVVECLYQDNRSEERVRSVVSICNSTYFKRVWTAMEFIRSGRVRMMVGDYTYLADLDDPAFLSRLHSIWNEEARHYKVVQFLEQKMNMGKNQVPWSLGALSVAKRLKRFNFAFGTVLLCKRGCRDRIDFLHALSGIVPTQSTILPGSNFKAEYYKIAWSCLKARDMSPLLITPVMGAIERRGPRHWSEFGYEDVFTWSLQDETHPLSIGHEIHFNDNDQLVSMKLQTIGTVSVIRRAFAEEQPFLSRSFSYGAKLALEFDGPDVKDFLLALERIYGSVATTSLADLEDKCQLNHLQEVLNGIYNRSHLPRWPIEDENNIEWLANILQLSNVRTGHSQSILAANNAFFGTIHCSPYDYVVGITCSGCLRTFAHKVGSFVLPTELQYAKAYRFPGLKYRVSLENGVGILVKNGKIVGRMIWATPACQCKITKTVTLGLPEFYLPARFGVNT
ncbi:hypothetical protein FAUST_6718 [Fusarium austroamericanum]|uniref:Heterokaryon incompatibility domain-containing protein n=1 Tax=Fusarium austroamericanum TaxID=282268 RepID=A0AAN5Z7T7_FUSAU|nr:hypothetical protein FAUST_6718 [Fusarium austroamericanum]